MPELLGQIQTKLSDIQQTASALPAGTDVSQASASLGDITKQVQSVIPVDTAQAPPPPTYEPQAPPDDLSLKAQVDKQRAELEATYRAQLEEANKRIAEAEKIQAEMRAKQEGVLEEADPLTQPFREDLEKAERERLKIEENFFANQALTNELDRLLTESIEMTRKLQTQRVPGLAGLQQSSRMVKAQEGVQSRIAVIEAVMSARNNQIGTATTFIDRSLSNIQQDRQDRLGYLESLFNFYETTRTEEGKKIFNLTQDQKAIIQEQTNLLKADLARAEAVADTIKDIILNNPTMAHEAGLSLNDTMEEITQKIAKWEYMEEKRSVKNTANEKGMRELTVNEALGRDDVFTYTDSQGNEMYFEIPRNWATQMIDNSLYRIDVNTGESELMIRGTSPLALRADVSGTGDISDIGGMAKAIMDNPALYKDLTPTAKSEVLLQLGRAGVDTTFLTQDPAMSNMVRAATTVIRDSREALNMMSTSTLFTTPGIMSAQARRQMAKVPGSDVYEIGMLIQSVKDNIGIDTLLNIKREGSGLGQVPQKQLETLQGVLGRLEIERDPRLLRRDLEDVLTMYQDIINKAVEGGTSGRIDIQPTQSTPEDIFDSALLGVQPEQVTPATQQVGNFFQQFFSNLWGN